MKIAHISTCVAPTPPPLSSSIVWVASYLTERLVELGHDVTLFATGDSKTKGRLWSYFDSPADFTDATNEIMHVGKACEYIAREGFDIIQNHNFGLGLVPMYLSDTPCVSTIHSPYHDTWTTLHSILAKRQHYVSVSYRQRELTPQLNWFGTVHNAVDVEDFPFSSEKDDYLLTMSRIARPKAIHLAIEAARKAERRLKIAGRLDKAWEQYFDEEVAPHIDGHTVEYLGEVGFEQKVALYQRAAGLLLPSRAAETFGMVIIEALACGTPVIALSFGPAHEVIKDGEVGYVVDDVDEMAAAVNKLDSISPSACRAHVVENFNTHLMAERYLEIYQRVLDSAPAMA